MDYHFIRPKSQEKSRGSDFKQFSKIIKSFLPVFVLSAILPFLIGFVVSPPQIGFFTRADVNPELRIWFEPASVISSVGGQTKLDVYAQFDAENKLIPEVSFEFSSDGGVALSSDNMTYSTPFRGKTYIGSVYVTPQEPGNVKVMIPEGRVIVVAYDEPLQINTGSATIAVR